MLNKYELKCGIVGMVIVILIVTSFVFYISDKGLVHTRREKEYIFVYDQSWLFENDMLMQRMDLNDETTTP